MEPRLKPGNVLTVVGSRLDAVESGKDAEQTVLIRGQKGGGLVVSTSSETVKFG